METIIPPEIDAYARYISSPETPVLSKLNRDTHAMVLRPRMLSGHLQGKLLEMISTMVQPQCILEIGTYTGYSAICMARGLQTNGVLHTIDHNPELEDFSRKYITEAGMAERIIQHTGEALDVIPAIDAQFDLVFIDADKENYIRYFDLAYAKTRTGGVILADNVLWSGKVVDAVTDPKSFKISTDALETPGITDPETAALIRFNEYVRNHPGLERLLLPFRDGLLICIKTDHRQPAL